MSEKHLDGSAKKEVHSCDQAAFIAHIGSYKLSLKNGQCSLYKEMVPVLTEKKNIQLNTSDAFG